MTRTLTPEDYRRLDEQADVVADVVAQLWDEACETGRTPADPILNEVLASHHRMGEVLWGSAPWTRFVSCTGSRVVLVEASQDEADAAVSAMWGDPYVTCSQCESSSFDSQPCAGPTDEDREAEIITAAEVAALLEQRT